MSLIALGQASASTHILNGGCGALLADSGCTGPARLLFILNPDQEVDSALSAAEAGWSLAAWLRVGSSASFSL